MSARSNRRRPQFGVCSVEAKRKRECFVMINLSAEKSNRLSSEAEETMNCPNYKDAPKIIEL